MTARTTIMISNVYIFVKKAPRTGISESPGTLNLFMIPSTNLSEAAPKTFLLMVLVRKEVRAIARIFITTPLITMFALK